MARTNFSIKPLIHSAPHRCKHTRTQPQPHAHTHNRSQWAKAIIIVFDHHEPHPHRCRSFCRIILLSERSASLRLVLFISSQLKCRPLPHPPPPPCAANFACCPLLRKFYSCLSSVRPTVPHSGPRVALFAALLGFVLPSWLKNK